MPRLLVSVRSDEEALQALAGGAHLIDIKDPTKGSLGRPNDATIAAVVRCIGGRIPLSVALGELVEAGAPPTASDLAYAKWGLSRSIGAAWQQALASAAALLPNGCKPVLAAYADWRRAEAIPPLRALLGAKECGVGTLLIDTFIKDGNGLLTWLSRDDLALLVREAHQTGIAIALAGQLKESDFPLLKDLQSDWVAVRGAACGGGDRLQRIEADRVRKLVETLA